MNKKYWDEFYKKDHTLIRSEFARWIAEYFSHKKDINIIDVGCGNGRDVKYFRDKFSKSEIHPFGIDQSYCEKDFILQSDFNSILNNFDIVYSRFFIHALKMEEIHRFIEWSSKSKYFVAEFRIRGDEPKIYKDHSRTLIDPPFIYYLLGIYNFEIEELHVGKGMAKYLEEDPLVCRIIAKNKNYEKGITN